MKQRQAPVVGEHYWIWYGGGDANMGEPRWMMGKCIGTNNFGEPLREIVWHTTCSSKAFNAKSVPIWEGPLAAPTAPAAPDVELAMEAG